MTLCLLQMEQGCSPQTPFIARTAVKSAIGTGRSPIMIRCWELFWCIPIRKQVFPLCPEPISKTDGSSKNDCQQNAMKRLLADFQREHPRLEAIFTADALSAKGPYLDAF